jgi:hypothetical protein
VIVRTGIGVGRGKLGIGWNRESYLLGKADIIIYIEKRISLVRVVWCGS